MGYRARLSIIGSLYRSEKFLPSYLAEIEAQTLFSECEVVLVLNDPSKREADLIEKFAQKHADMVKAIHLDGVENLGASWNRAWRTAKAPIVAIWNVDDRRTHDSLEVQVQALEENRDWVLSYGDYIAVDAYGAEHGVLRQTPKFSSFWFRRGIPQGGAFMVFRTQLWEKSGGFDEQFSVGPDLDFLVRLAVQGARMGRANKLVGYFTDAGEGLSTRDDQAKADLRAVQMRYAIYDKLVDQPSSLRFDVDINRLLIEGKKVPLEEFIPGIRRYRRGRQILWVLAYLRRFTRILLKKLGLSNAWQRFQRQVIKRDL